MSLRLSKNTRRLLVTGVALFLGLGAMTVPAQAHHWRGPIIIPIPIVPVAPTPVAITSAWGYTPAQLDDAILTLQDQGYVPMGARSYCYVPEANGMAWTQRMARY